jgi:hypothetical protein
MSIALLLAAQLTSGPQNMPQPEAMELIEGAAGYCHQAVGIAETMFKRRQKGESFTDLMEELDQWTRYNLLLPNVWGHLPARSQSLLTLHMGASMMANVAEAWNLPIYPEAEREEASQRFQALVASRCHAEYYLIERIRSDVPTSAPMSDPSDHPENGIDWR